MSKNQKRWGRQEKLAILQEVSSSPEAQPSKSREVLS